jgi:hypothetical protein
MSVSVLLLFLLQMKWGYGWKPPCNTGSRCLGCYSVSVRGTAPTHRVNIPVAAQNGKGRSVCAWLCRLHTEYMSDNLTEERWLSSLSDLLEITFIYCVPFLPQTSIRLWCEGQDIQRLCQLKLVTNELLSFRLSLCTWVHYRTLIVTYLHCASVDVSVLN